jgi:acyl-CoA reductase-like NAD-dependent aldehyde dehydrogenase
MTAAPMDAVPPRLVELLDHPWRLMIGGILAEPATGRTYQVSNPATREVIAIAPDGGPEDVDLAGTAAEKVRTEWAETEALVRAAAVRALADRIEEHAEELALLDAVDAGLPLAYARIDVATGVATLRMFAGLALELKGTTIPATANLHLTVREPVGITARIVPFNHPLMFACKIASPLVAGNPVVLKPPEAAPLSSLRLGELAADLFPPGVLSVVVGDGPQVPDALVRHRLVRRIGFIGSEPVGRAIQRSAAETGVKDVSLELGGKNAKLVFADSDLDAVARSAVEGMDLTWSGQSCGSTSRLLVQREIHDELIGRIVELVESRTIADPLDERSEQGPLIDEKQYRRVLDYLDIARAEGARVHTGGSPATGAGLDNGWFVAPTVLSGLSATSRVATEEIFGPVLVVLPFDDEAEALRTANAVDYGLTASIWTSDVGRAVRIARSIEAGFVWINGSARHFPNVPYGGVKGSGIGREESLEELQSYTAIKAISIMRTPGDERSDRIPDWMRSCGLRRGRTTWDGCSSRSRAATTTGPTRCTRAPSSRTGSTSPTCGSRSRSRSSE